MDYIPISKLKISDNVFDIEDVNSITNIIKSGRLTTGDVVDKFESDFWRYSGCKYKPIATNSGTSALHLALECVKDMDNLVNPNDDNKYIIVPSYSFNSTANSVIMAGFKPIFADVNCDGLITLDSIKKVIDNNKNLDIIGVIGVHLYGKTFDVESIADEYKDILYIIEDCAQAVGAYAEWKDGYKHVGLVGDFGCFSFYSTKNIACGEGGMIISDKHDMNEHIKSLRNHGIVNNNKTKQSMKYNQPNFGYNYRMCNINASIGISQLKELDMYNNKRFTNATIYDDMITNYIVRKPKLDREFKKSHVFNQYTINVKDNGGLFLNYKLQSYLENKGIQSEVYYPEPLPLLKYYIKRSTSLGYNQYDDYKVAKWLSSTSLSIPVHPHLTLREILYIVNAINEYTYEIGDKFWNDKHDEVVT